MISSFPFGSPLRYQASRTRCGIAPHDLRRGDPAPSRLAAVMRDARARMLVARTVSRAESLTPRCSVLAISQMLVKEHSSSRIVANSGEVSDSVCSRPAAAILDARAHMLAARILSRAKSLTLRCSVLICRRKTSTGFPSVPAEDERRKDPTLGERPCDQDARVAR